jgi:hypothetical protein
MTEDEWLTCDDPGSMLAFLYGGEVSARKLGLFACGYCRQVWHLLTDERSRVCVEVGERSADGLAGKEKFAAAERAAAAAFIERRLSALKDLRLVPQVHAALAATDVAMRHCQWVFGARVEVANPLTRALIKQREEARPLLVRLLRDIFGNPFRPFAVPPGCLRWHDGLLVSMAQRMYEARDFADMPILADALEDAGCDDQSILGHLRGPGPHVRGCWVVDLLLAKQ